MFSKRELALDLNGDRIPERIVFFANRLRGLELPRNVCELSEIGGVIADGFAVFDGVRPMVPVFYRYNEYGGYQLRLDTIDGQQLLVSDGGRDQPQQVWGWWRYPELWPPSGWEARERVKDQQQERYGSWIKVQRIAIVVGK